VGSVNYGQSLQGLHNTKSLRTPEIDNSDQTFTVVRNKSSTKTYVDLGNHQQYHIKLVELNANKMNKNKLKINLCLLQEDYNTLQNLPE